MFLNLLKAGKSEFHTETSTVVTTYTHSAFLFMIGKGPENPRFLVYKKPNAKNFPVKRGQSTKTK